MAVLQVKEQWADNIFKLPIAASVAHSFKVSREKEEFLTAMSTPVTEDSGGRLLREIIDWKTLPVNPLEVQISEVQEWENKINKLNAIEAISGLLNKLSSAQLEIFEENVRRRPFF
jgi:hypothetical protein